LINHTRLLFANLSKYLLDTVVLFTDKQQM